MIYPVQIRAARALLGINQQVLAERSGVGIATIKRIEAAGGVLIGNAQTLLKLQKALEAAGIAFIDPSGGKGPGVRLTAPLD